MDRHVSELLARPEPMEPGPELEAKLKQIEAQVARHLSRGSPADSGPPPLEPVSAHDVLLLVACIRGLVADRESLLQEIEVLELRS